MPNLMTMTKNRQCPECGRYTLKVSMLNATVGRTAFLADSCIKCGYIRNYTITLPIPTWQWLTGAVVLLVAAGAAVCVLVL